MSDVHDTVLARDCVVTESGFRNPPHATSIGEQKTKICTDRGSSDDPVIRLT
jgi:hypothetical protein